MIPRVSTGVHGFDQLVENGFPVDSIVLVAGSPGAGKTTFAARFLYEGATNLGERGVYVCFAETKKSLLRGLLRFGWDFERLEMERRIAVLDLTTTEESGLQSNLDKILDCVTTTQAKRLVIDSFTAMSMAMTRPIDVRYLIHLFYKFLHMVGCTTIMISDTPWGSQKIGSGVEEFIADGILLMNTGYNERGFLRRELKILKMRSTDHSRRVHEYDITKEGVVITPVSERKAQQIRGMKGNEVGRLLGIKGIGKTRAKKLITAGILSPSDLALADLESLAKMTPYSIATLRRWQSMARKLLEEAGQDERGATPIQELLTYSR